MYVLVHILLVRRVVKMDNITPRAGFELTLLAKPEQESGKLPDAITLPTPTSLYT